MLSVLNETMGILFPAKLHIGHRQCLQYNETLLPILPVLLK